MVHTTTVRIIEWHCVCIIYPHCNSNIILFTFVRRSFSEKETTGLEHREESVQRKRYLRSPLNTI